MAFESMCTKTVNQNSQNSLSQVYILEGFTLEWSKVLGDCNLVSTAVREEWWFLKTSTHYYCDLASFPSQLKSKQVRGNYTPLFTTEASTVLKVWVILDAKVG